MEHLSTLLFTKATVSDDLDGGDGQIGKPDKTAESQETAVEKEPAGVTNFIFGLQSSVKISQNRKNFRPFQHYLQLELPS